MNWHSCSNVTVPERCTSVSLSNSVSSSTHTLPSPFKCWSAIACRNHADDMMARDCCTAAMLLHLSNAAANDDESRAAVMLFKPSATKCGTAGRASEQEPTAGLLGASLPADHAVDVAAAATPPEPSAFSCMRVS